MSIVCMCYMQIFSLHDSDRPYYIMRKHIKSCIPFSKNKNTKPGHQLLHILGYCSETLLFEPRCEKKRSSGFPTRSNTNQAVQAQKMARGLKFRI